MWSRMDAESIWGVVPTTLQLGCDKNSSGFLGAPKVAVGAVKLQLVTSKLVLSRQTSRVRVSSSPLFIPKALPGYQ
jgi:hypothetical protein